MIDLKWYRFFIILIIGNLFSWIINTQAPVFLNSQNGEVLNLNKKDYLIYQIQFRHLHFLNGSSIDTEASIPGTQKGNISFTIEEVASDGNFLINSILEIPLYYHSQQRTWFNSNNSNFRSEDQSSLLGMFWLWMDPYKLEMEESYIISSNYITGFNASGVKSGVSTINLGILGHQEVQMLKVAAIYNGHQLNWTSYYDLDTKIFLRMSGEPADPLLLGMHGVQSLDFIVSLIDTNIDIGEPADNDSGEVGYYINTTFGLGIIYAMGVCSFIAFSFVILKEQKKRKKRKKDLKKKRRRKLMKSRIRKHHK